MAPTMKDLGIDRLGVDDRLALVQEIWDSIAADPHQTPLTDAQKELLSQRSAELDANPEIVVTWDEIIRHVRGAR